jgi:phosphatidylserine/phosphatidylglycerophosphate/cardiolipin synthase-like enzyme
MARDKRQIRRPVGGRHCKRRSRQDGPKQPGELLTGDMFFPSAAFADGGEVNAGLMHSIPTIGSTPAERFLALSIAGSRKTLYVSNSYFVPTDDFCNLLIKAVKRGVDVRVLTVSSKTDVKTTWYAGRASYEKLLKDWGADLRVPADDDACQDDGGRWPLSRDRLAELRQSLARVQ